MTNSKVTKEYLEGVLSYPATGQDALDFQSMAKEILELRAQISRERDAEHRKYVELFDRTQGTPCEQIRWQQEAEQRASLAAGIALEQAAKVCDSLSKRDYGPYAIDRQELDEEASAQCAKLIRSLIPNAAEVERVMKDAERYRLLRDCKEGSAEWYAVNRIIESPTSEWDAELDSAIDAKREGKQ